MFGQEVVNLIVCVVVLAQHIRKAQYIFVPVATLLNDRAGVILILILKECTWSCSCGSNKVRTRRTFAIEGSTRKQTAVQQA